MTQVSQKKKKVFVLQLQIINTQPHHSPNTCTHTIYIVVFQVVIAVVIVTVSQLSQPSQPKPLLREGKVVHGQRAAYLPCRSQRQSEKRKCRETMSVVEAQPPSKKRECPPRDVYVAAEDKKMKKRAKKSNRSSRSDFHLLAQTRQSFLCVIVCVIFLPIQNDWKVGQVVVGCNGNGLLFWWQKGKGRCGC